MTETEANGARHLAVDQPILNNPFKEPTRYWLYDSSTGEPRKENGRRLAGYYFRERRTGGPQLSYLADEQYNELPVINELRRIVREWRERGYPGVSPITRQLLAYWTREDRERRLFFCQVEAAETIIYLLETDTGRRRLSGIEPDSGLGRLGIKMATGSGKTVVMAMLAAWSVLNKVHAPGRTRFTDAVLVVCPNLTVRERLGGESRTVEGDEPARPLIPGARGNYYEDFDLVPPPLMPELGRGRFLITNWHAFLPQDDSRRRGIVQRGAESDAAFCARVLKELGNARNLLVINDEAHHCYRPRATVDAEEQPSAEAREENEEATVWIDGLDRIQAVRGVLTCLDLSATPFFITGSGYPEGTPFPWLVSDFGLVDAIESGIVKIPRVPVATDSGRPVPEYFRLWEHINGKLPPSERGNARRKPKPEAIVREADAALQQLAGEWTDTFEQFKREKHAVPPCLIVVADNTDISELLFERIARDGQVFPDYLRNDDGRDVTMRIDSKLLARAEEGDRSGSREERAEALRRRVATVGKEGESGADVRCVVSVGMLTEGWDAQNVTHILGLRAFQSQLLCEQVVGRGLRRMNYDFDELDEDGVPVHVEYVDVYGIPFEVIPVKKVPTDRQPPPPKETTPVAALPERSALRIEFPRVEGFAYQVRDAVGADVESIERLRIEPSVEPTQTIVRAKVGYELGQPGLWGPGETETQTRRQFYESTRMHQIEFELARRMVTKLVGLGRFQYAARSSIFPQVLAIVRQYLTARVDYGSIDHREVGLQHYMEIAEGRLLTAIRPMEDDQPKLLPRLERFRPRGSTDEVFFRTTRPVRQTLKSHVSHVVMDSPVWEGSAAFYLETSPHVQSYARNDHLDLAIPYISTAVENVFLPDFVVRLTNGLHLLLEVKGMETEQDRDKFVAAKRWCDAVNSWGQMGRWAFDVAKRPGEVPGLLGRWAG